MAKRRVLSNMALIQVGFAGALFLLKRLQTVRRLSWPEDATLILIGDETKLLWYQEGDQAHLWRPTHADLLADDWVDVKELAELNKEKVDA